MILEWKKDIYKNYTKKDKICYNCNEEINKIVKILYAISSQRRGYRALKRDTINLPLQSRL